MKNVGILAAMTISGLGPVSDVACFFNSIVFFLEDGNRESKYPVITDRLYCRSVQHSELAELKSALEEVNIGFELISTDLTQMIALGLDQNNSRLFLNGKTLANVFSRFFEVIIDALKCSSIFYEEFKEYVPLRIGFTDVPDCIIDINRPDDLYNALAPNQPPFWLR